MSAASYPVRVEGHLDPGLSRWLWLVKWLLAIPHYIVLFFLWIAFVVVSVIAFFAILFTGRYPAGLFGFNVGVLRWSWRVGFYAYSALGTDRYPPFTLADVPDYPARLTVDRPDRLSRGLVLVKWWLLAIPHYLVVGVLVGGAWVAWDDDAAWWTGGGLIGLLVIIGAVALLFSGRFPSSIFDLVVGLDRWVFRVVGYAALMTDAYPPFRLDMGPDEPGAPAEARQAAAPPGPSRHVGGAGGVAMAVIGGLLVLIGLGAGAVGTIVTVADQTGRDSDEFLMSPTRRFDTASYALLSESHDIRGDGPDWLYSDDLLGTVRIRAEGERPLFVGIGLERDIEMYLGGVERAVVDEWGDGGDEEAVAGGPPAVAPGRLDIWSASATGTGEVVMDWKVIDGSHRAVVMNADASRGVDADVRIGARLSGLIWVGIGILCGAALALAVGILLIVLAVRRGSSGSEEPASTAA